MAPSRGGVHPLWFLFQPPPAVAVRRVEAADDVEPAKMKRRFRRVDAALGRYAKAPRRWFFRRPRAAGVGRRKG